MSVKYKNSLVANIVIIKHNARILYATIVTNASSRVTNAYMYTVLLCTRIHDTDIPYLGKADFVQVQVS